MSVDASIRRRTQACRPPYFNDLFHSGASWRQRAICAPPEAIARGIINAIEYKRDVVYLPGFWRLVMLIVAHVREGIFKRLKF